jgi:hypothetical protein
MKKIKAFFKPCSLTSLGRDVREYSSIRSSLVKIKFIVLFFSIFALPVLVSAQVGDLQDPFASSAIPTPTDGIFNCSEQYNPNGVEIVSSITVPNTLAGAILSIPLQVTNTNNYPLINGAVYIKILKADMSDLGIKNGPSIIEQRYLVKNLNLAANESKQLDFSWNVPLYLTSGKYYLATYFVTDEKFNYAGLSYTNDNTGGLIEFNVSGENKDTIFLNKDNIKINDKNYSPLGLPAEVDSKQPVKVQIEIVNNSKKLERFPVDWSVYTWDGLSETNLILSKSDGAFLKPSEKKTLELDIPNNKNSVYYVTVTGTYNDTKSIVNVRYIRDGVPGARLDSASVSTYPLKMGEEAQVYSCFQSTSNVATNNTKLVITLKDEKGNIITENTYSGNVSPDLTGFRKVFTPTKDLYNFSIESNLYREDVLLDSATVNYTCSDILKDKCPVETNLSSFWSQLLTPLYIYSLIGILLMLIIFIVLRLIKK